VVIPPGKTDFGIWEKFRGNFSTLFTAGMNGVHVSITGCASRSSADFGGGYAVGFPPLPNDVAVWWIASGNQSYIDIDLSRVRDTLGQILQVTISIDIELAAPGGCGMRVERDNGNESVVLGGAFYSGGQQVITMQCWLDLSNHVWA
jgi:hypothetical protein